MTPGFWLSLAFTVMIAGAFGWLLWETIRLGINKTPITGLVRYTEDHMSFKLLLAIYFAIGAVVGFLVDHFAHF